MMESFGSVVYSIQIVSSLIIAWVIYRYYMLYKRDYLKFWSFSFVSLSAYLLLALALNNLSKVGLEFHSIPGYLLALLKINAGYLQIVWLFLGTYVLIRPQGVSPIIARRALLFTVVLASALCSLYAFDPEAGLLRNTLRNSSRYILGGLAFIFVAIAIYKYLNKTSLGKRLVCLAFFFYGLEMAVIGALSFNVLLGGDRQVLFVLIRYHGIFELLIYPIIALGLVIWLLERERYKGQIIYEKLSNQDTLDPLTGLLNRHGFERKLNSWKNINHDNKRNLLVVLIGIDQFKRINQAVGVRQGDEVLIAFANRVVGELGNMTYQARLSGDVFACALDKDLAKKYHAEKLRKIFSRPLKIHQQKIHLEVSVGGTWMSDLDSVDDILIHAQRALESAKSHGGNVAVMFDDTMPEKIDSLQLENELRYAISKSQFEPFLQPILDAKTMQIIGFEMLTRWRHPEKGILPPVEFLPYLAQLNLMPQLDLWTLKQAVELLSAWQRKGLNTLSVAINLSAEGLQDERYLELAPSIIQRLGPQTDRLHIEVTENSAMTSIRAGKYSLSLLNDLGVKISIDDFGTGYSSLNYLKSFPAHKIKFDRSFIMQMETDKTTKSILKALIPLCHDLGKTVVAEGVETKESIHYAKMLGFDQLQGYYFSKPVPVEQAEALLAAQSTNELSDELDSTKTSQ
ncbi:EAL domain-containing protein [Aliikangiella marina]|uniref:EAL domain-containing protein n=1 Tax=Aliikangiella marina TaxID=1712262 RepID=A0A545TBT7_9GAMM|nr:GGDEF domain-containing phosphodiesterase [Aliikangiella marina]TQV74685.1 EAL domain-containing protein [Aliikangiella marina]